MKKFSLNKTKLALSSLGAFAFTLLNSTIPIYATTIQTSKFFTGTKKMIDDGTSALLILAPIITVVLVIYFFIRRGMCDEMDTKKWNSRIMAAIVCGIGAVSASLLITLISTYYK